jgi:hypothetical protein
MFRSRTDWPEAHRASYTTDAGSLFSAVEQPGRYVEHPLPFSVEVQEKLDLLWGFMVCYRLTFTFTFSKTDVI